MADDYEMLNFEELDLDYWKNNDEKRIFEELNGLADRILNVSDQLRDMVENNDFKKTEAFVNALMMSDLSIDGWVYSYMTRNKKDFPDNGASRPSWYQDFTPEEKALYEDTYRHFCHLHVLYPALHEMLLLLTGLDLLHSFRLMRIGKILTGNSFTDQTWKEADEDAANVESIINVHMDVLNREAQKSERYYAANKGRLGKSDLNTGYRKERIKDYVAWVNKYPVHERMYVNSEGVFTVNPATYADAAVIDGFMDEIAKMDKLEENLNQKLEEAAKMDTVTLPRIEKEIQDGTFYTVILALKQLAKTILQYVKTAYWEYDAYKNGRDASPYCFMKKLPALGSPRTKYAFRPYSWDPMRSGTDYRRLYSMEAEALTQHCKDFVYNYGHQELK